MAKKRSCRRTNNESQIHATAVRLRKMTDEQLVDYVKECERQAEIEGYNKGRQEAIPSESPNRDVKQFLEQFKVVPGIGKTTYMKLVNYAEENGYV